MKTMGEEAGEDMDKHREDHEKPVICYPHAHLAAMHEPAIISSVCAFVYQPMV